MIKTLRKIFSNKWIRYTTVSNIVGLIMMGLLLLFTDRYDLQAFVDVTSFVAILLISFGWMIYISNAGLFDVLVYGLESFFKAFVGKRPEKTFLEHRFERETVPSVVYKSIWLSGVMFLIAFGILYTLYKMN